MDSTNRNFRDLVSAAIQQYQAGRVFAQPAGNFMLWAVEIQPLVLLDALSGKVVHRGLKRSHARACVSRSGCFTLGYASGQWWPRFGRQPLSTGLHIIISSSGGGYSPRYVKTIIHLCIYVTTQGPTPIVHTRRRLSPCTYTATSDGHVSSPTLMTGTYPR